MLIIEFAQASQWRNYVKQQGSKFSNLARVDWQLGVMFGHWNKTKRLKLSSLDKSEGMYLMNRVRSCVWNIFLHHLS